MFLSVLSLGRLVGRGFGRLKGTMAKKQKYLEDEKPKTGTMDTAPNKPGAGETPDDGPEKEEVKAWANTIQKTLAWRDNIAAKARWAEFIDEYKGKWDHVAGGMDINIVPLNLVLAYVKTEIARLYFRDPWITVNAKKLEDLGSAQIAEALVNYLWGELNLKHEIKRALLDALLVGHGWIKLGYSAKFGTVESKPEDGDTKKQVMPTQFIQSENVFAYHVPWRDVLFSPDSLRPPYDSRWLAFRVTKPLRAIKESGIYKNVDDLKPSEYKEKNAKDDHMVDVKTATLWEIWDMDNKKVRTISVGHEKYLREIDWPYEMPGFPAVMFGFTPIPGEPYPMSDIAPGEPQIIEAMKMMAIMLNHLKRWNRQIFMQESFMTELEEAKFKNSVDGAIIHTQGKPADGIYIPPYAPVQQDIYAVWNLIMDIFRNVVGQSEVDRGGKATAQTRTLGELRAQLQGGRSRADEKVDLLEDQISEVAKKLLMISKEKLTKPRIIRIIGEKAMQDAVMKNRPSAGDQGAFAGPGMMTTTGADLPDDMDVDTLAGSTIPLNKENKIQILSEFTPLLQFMGIQPGSQASREYGREVLREVDIKAMERIMDIANQEAGQPSPEQQQQQQEQQMEQAKMQQDMQSKQQDQQMKMQSEAIRLKTTQVQAQAAMTQAKTQETVAAIKLKENIIKHLLNQAKVAQNSAMNGNTQNGDM